MVIGLANNVLDPVILFAFEDDRLAYFLKDPCICASFVLPYAFEYQTSTHVLHVMLSSYSHIIQCTR